VYKFIAEKGHMDILFQDIGTVSVGKCPLFIGMV